MGGECCVCVCVLGDTQEPLAGALVCLKGHRVSRCCVCVQRSAALVQGACRFFIVLFFSTTSQLHHRVWVLNVSVMGDGMCMGVRHSAWPCHGYALSAAACAACTPYAHTGHSCYCCRGWSAGMACARLSSGVYSIVTPGPPSIQEVCVVYPKLAASSFRTRLASTHMARRGCVPEGRCAQCTLI